MGGGGLVERKDAASSSKRLPLPSSGKIRRSFLAITPPPAPPSPGLHLLLPPSFSPPAPPITFPRKTFPAGKEEGATSVVIVVVVVVVFW